MTAKITMMCDGIMCSAKYDLEIPDWSGGSEAIATAIEEYIIEFPKR